MSENDLSSPVNETARANQAPPTGQNILIEIGGVLHAYSHDEWLSRAERFAKILDAEMAWIEGFVSHAPTVGNHYESILRNLLSEYLPKNKCVATGFAFDSLRRKCSPQIDILVYSDIDYSPIYKKGEFVIVDANSVLGVCEVKKNLKSSELKEWINKTIGQNLGWCHSYPFGVQQSSIFAFECGVSTKRLAKIVVESIEDFIHQFASETKSGAPAFLNVYQIALPAIYLRDREEYISVSVTQDSESHIFSKLTASICKASGANGISSFLSSMSPETNGDPNYRDFVSNFLVECVQDIAITTPVLLMRKMTSAQLLGAFSDARDILRRESAKGRRAFGAIVPAWANTEGFESLEAFSRVPGFTWEMTEANAG